MLKCSSGIGMLFWDKAKEVVSWNISSYPALPLAPASLVEHSSSFPKTSLAPSPHPLRGWCQTRTYPIALLTLYNEICHTARSGERWRGGRQRSGEEEKKGSYAEEFAAFSEQGKRWQCVTLLGGREKPAAPCLLPACRPAGAEDGRSARPTPSRAGWFQIALP